MSLGVRSTLGCTARAAELCRLKPKRLEAAAIAAEQPADERDRLDAVPAAVGVLVVGIMGGGTGGSVGVGFAIPAETAAPIVERLRRGETIERGYLGVGIGPVTDDFAAALGLPRNRGEVVQSVVDGEAAARAGIEAGDVVISVDGKDVTPDQTLSFLVANIAPGTTVPVTLIRDSAGFIAQRIIGCIVNIASDIAQQRIATPTDIDLAVNLGLGYPKGPLALGDTIGAAVILEGLR